MKAVVVYESHWGNTAAVAHAIAEGIGSGTRVMSTAEASAAALEGADLLVVGAPVIGFRLSTEQALENMRVKPGKGNPPDLSHPPVRSWLDTLPAGTGDAAAFDTRVRTVCARPRHRAWSRPPSRGSEPRSYVKGSGD
jgi:hypothetical protein